jgi:hypothetical protein
VSRTSWLRGLGLIRGSGGTLFRERALARSLHFCSRRRSSKIFGFSPLEGGGGSGTHGSRRAFLAVRLRTGFTPREHELRDRLRVGNAVIARDTARDAHTGNASPTPLLLEPGRRLDTLPEVLDTTTRVSRFPIGA